MFAGMRARSKHDPPRILLAEDDADTQAHSGTTTPGPRRSYLGAILLDKPFSIGALRAAVSRLVPRS